MPDAKLVHDQIIEHELHTLSPEQVFKLLVIELRGLRADVQALVSQNTPEKRKGKWPLLPPASSFE